MDQLTKISALYIIIIIIIMSQYIDFVAGISILVSVNDLYSSILIGGACTAIVIMVLFMSINVIVINKVEFIYISHV